MRTAYISLFSLALASFIFSCQPNSGNADSETGSSAERELSETENPYLGNYVSDMYDRRGEGYDWVAV